MTTASSSACKRIPATRGRLRNRNVALAISTAALMLLQACSAGSGDQLPNRVEVDFPGMGDCRAMFADIDARIDAAGVRHAGYHRVPGMPYLRSDRLLASFAHEVDGLDDFGIWIRRMRAFDIEARDYELMNLGMPEAERVALRSDLQRCAHGLSYIDLEDEDNVEWLRHAVVPPDERSSVTRKLGLYPLAVPLLKAYVERRHRQTYQRFAEPPSAADADRLYFQAESTRQSALVPPGFDVVLQDSLGFPGMIESAWRAVAEKHAPRIWTTAVPGMPVWTPHGATVDSRIPAVYFQIGFTRMGAERLVQVNYVMWFAGLDESGAPSLDSLVWRVTLDRDGEPLLYDSVHGSGSDHLLFPVQRLSLRGNDDYWRQPLAMPQTELPDGGVVLKLSVDGTTLQGIVERETAAPSTVHEYRLVDYDRLFALPHPEGGTRSLFDSRGRVPGREAETPAWLQVSGIDEPAALRQLGRHPLTLVGRDHFDDAFLLDRLFEKNGAARSP
jgi:hypothetical protein